MMQRVGRYYVRYFNKTYQRSGTLGRINAYKQNTQGINDLPELPVSQFFTSAFLFEIVFNIVRSERTETTSGMCIDKHLDMSGIPTASALWHVVRCCF